jgi:glutamate---cysteine ligase / carboxylate-amine ligase
VSAAPDSAPRAPLHLFEAFGIELEYMLVDRETLDVRPVADQLLRAAAGEQVCDFEDGAIAWSNELALHVIELKTNGPAASLEGLPAKFDRSLRRIDALLEPLGARILPTAMHPWMDPARETRLWPHDSNAIYEAFHRIFDCRGHGWGNLQSMHVNLPFADDEEFGRLHAAIRLALPILPALAASSPIVELRPTGFADTRLEVYRKNSARIPSVAGRVVPEPVFTRADYEEEILGRIYRDLEPFDPQGLLRYEFANARGAIARFDRMAIEIRVLDVQETPRADLAIAAAVTALVRAHCEGRFGSSADQRAWPVEPLAQILLDCIRDGERSVIADREYLALLGYPGGKCTAGELWQHLVGELWLGSRAELEPWLETLGLLLREGTLSRRILRAAGESPTRATLTGIYRELAECAVRGELFRT